MKSASGYLSASQTPLLAVSMRERMGAKDTEGDEKALRHQGRSLAFDWEIVGHMT